MHKTAINHLYNFWTAKYQRRQLQSSKYHIPIHYLLLMYWVTTVCILDFRNTATSRLELPLEEYDNCQILENKATWQHPMKIWMQRCLLAPFHSYCLKCLQLPDTMASSFILCHKYYCCQSFITENQWKKQLHFQCFTWSHTNVFIKT